MSKRSFLYKFAPYPDNKSLIELVNNAANQVYDSIANTDFKDAGLGSDFTHFISYKLDSLETNLIKYSYQIIWCCNNINKELKDVVAVDHGGGTGMFGMLAKKCGIGTVIYNDINLDWSNDAMKYAKYLKNPADHYVIGESDELVKFIKDNSLKVDMFCSYNVIEHVYSMAKLIKDVKEIFTDDLRIYMSTGATQYKKSMNKQLTDLHIRYEYGRDYEVMDMEPFVYVRRRMISEMNKAFTLDELDHLAKATRGMEKNDIKTTVENYMKTGVKPPMPKHPTNTCDPETGYWYENMMDPYELQEIFRSHGIDVQVKAGFYGHPKNPIKRLASNVFNLIIRTLGTKALFLSPYWSLVRVK